MVPGGRGELEQQTVLEVVMNDRQTRVVVLACYWWSLLLGWIASSW